MRPLALCSAGPGVTQQPACSRPSLGPRDIGRTASWGGGSDTEAPSVSVTRLRRGELCFVKGHVGSFGVHSDLLSFGSHSLSLRRGP